MNKKKFDTKHSNIFTPNSKKGGVVLFFVILAIVTISIVGAGIYFYNYYIFKTLRVCLTDGENTNLPCENSSQCREFASTLIPEINLSDAPIFIQDSFNKALDKSVYCNNTCFVRNFRGVNPNTQKFELLEKCKDNEIEIKIDIRGKEAIDTLKWLKAKSE